MKCHYVVLGLDSDCSCDDLKKAYRKLALEWHPDKNPDRLEEATENFQLIQQAYEILSDPQERAWYDRHKDDILRGGSEQAYKDDCLDVYKYFTTSCFKGYNDEERGFYTVYRHIFEEITAEDKPFMDDDEIEIPQFGYSYSSYEEVVHEFYAYWQSYCTAKTFSWVDKYGLTEARKSGAGRQVIRLMEKENKKLRDQHKKLRNEEVRELVAFVRKRDKRVQAAKKRMEEMKAEKAKKVEEQRRKQVAERNKALEDYKEAEWSSMSQFENHLNEIESNLDATFGSIVDETNVGDVDEEEDFSDLYCVACEKDFRSEKAFKNHENSKKHKENVILLKSLMEEEEEAMSSSQNPDLNPNEEVLLESDQEDNTTSKDLLDELVKSSTKSKKKKKKTKTATTNNTESTTLTEIEVEVENISIAEDTTDKIADPIGKLENNKISSSCNEEKNDTNSQNKEIGTQKPSNKSIPAKKKCKKDKGQASENDFIESCDETIDKQPSACGTCSNVFQSRNKLFEHLRQTGHAVYKNENASSGKKQKKKKL